MEWNLDTEEQQEVQPQEETEQELQVTAAPTDNYLQQQVNQALTSEQLEDSTLLNNERPKNFDTDQEGFWGAVSNTPKAWGTGILRQAGGFLGSLEMLPAMMYDTVSTYIQNPLADVLGIEEMKVNYQEDFRDNILNPFDTFGDTGYTIKEIGKRLSPMLETEGTFEENLANKNYDEAAEQLWYMVNENAPQIGIQLLMAAIPTTAPIGLGFIGASKAGGEWLELVNDEDSDLTAQEQYTNAVAKGASELVATAIFSQPYFNSIFNRGTQAAFVESLRKVFSSKLGTVGISTGLNVLEENLVNVLDTLADEATGNYDTEITLEDYFKDWKATSAVAAVFGVGTGALDIAMNPSEMKAQKVLEQVVKNEDPVEQVKQQVDNEIEQVIEQKKVETKNQSLEKLAKQSTSDLDFVEKLYYDSDLKPEELGITNSEEAKAYWAEVTNNGEKIEISPYKEYPDKIEDIQTGEIVIPDVEIEIDEALDKEANAGLDNKIRLGGKFKDTFSTEEEVTNALLHEVAHIIRQNNDFIDEAINTNPEAAFGRFNKQKDYWEGISYNPEESFAQAFANYFTNPEALKTNNPEAFRLLDKILKASNIPQLTKGIVEQYNSNIAEDIGTPKASINEQAPTEVEKSYPIQESIEEVQARDDGLFDLEFMKTAKPLKDSEGNYLFTRIDKADSDLSASERPQGLYATLVYNKDKPSLAFADVDGDTLYRGKVKSDKVLELEATKIEHERFIKAGRDNGEVDAGVGALKELVSEERFEELRTMNKEEVEAEIIKEYPDYEGKLDIEGAGDAYDLLSAYGAIKAREAGYTAIVNESAEVLGKDTSEIAILNEENVEWGWNEEQTDTTPTDDQIEGTTEETTVEKSPEYEELARIAKTSLTPETFMNRVFVEEEVDFNILSELEIDTTQEARAFFDEATNGGTEFEIEDTRPSYDDQISEYTTRLDEIQDKRTKEARKLKNQIAELENLKEIDSLEEPEVDQRLEELEAQMEEVDLRTKEGRALKKQKKALDSMKYKFKRDRMFDRQIQEQVTNFYKARRVSEEQATAYANDLAENGVTVTDDMKQEITSALTPKQGYAMNLHRITDVDPKVRALINEVADMTKDSTTKTMKSVAQTVETALQAEDSIEQGYKVSKLIEELQIEADRVPRHQKLARFAREVIVSNAKVLTEMAELISNAAGTVSEIEYAMFAQRVALQHTLTHNLDRLVGNAARTLSLQRAMVNGEMVDMSTLTPQQIASSPDAQTKTKDLVDSFGGTKNIQKLAQKIASKKDGSLAELNEAMTEVSKYHKVLDALIEYRSSNVLMNVSTHATNVISQTGRILLDDFINFISATYNSVLGYEEAMTFAKAKAQLLGHLEGIINAFRNPIVSMKQAGETVLGKAPSTFDLVMLALRNPTKFEQIREATNFGNDRATMEGINKHAFSAESLLSKEFREGSLGSFIGAALDYYGAMSRNIAFGGLQAGDAPFSSAGYYHALAGQLYDLQKNLPDEVNGVPKRDYLKSLKDKVVALRKLRTLDPYIQRDILIEEGINGDTGKSRTEIESEVIEKYIGDTLRGVKPDEMIKIADLDQTALQHSKEVTWKDDFAEGTLGRSIEKFAHAHKEVKLLQMFIHTPLKIFAYAFRNTPLSPTTFKNLLGTNGKAAQIQAFGAVTSTVLIIGAGLALYSSNNLTPSARDYKERERMYQAGVVPNSFRIGDKWYSFNRIEPLSYYLSTAANGARAAHEAWADPDEDSNLSDRLLSTVGQTAGAMMSTMLDKNYFKGLQDFVAMVQGDGSKYYAGNLVASFVPTYTLRRNIYDYTYGGANPFYDKYLRTDSGLVRRDVYGKPIAHYKTPTGMNPTPMTESLIRQETYDLGLNLSGFGRAIGGVILNEAQQNELRRYFDEELKAEEQMNRFVSSASYQKIPTAEAKRDAIRKVWLKLKGQARKSLFRDPEYLKEYQKNIQKPETQGYYEDMFRGKGTGTIRKPKINFVKQIETFKSEE